MSVVSFTTLSCPSFLVVVAPSVCLLASFTCSDLLVCASVRLSH